MRRRGYALCTVLGLAAGLAGCGSGSPADQVRAVSSDALSAFGKGDYRAFCGLVSNAYRARITAARGSPDSSVASCAKVLEQAANSSSTARAQVKAQVAGLRIVAVRVTGTTARITMARRLGNLTEEGQATAVFENGDWRLDSLPRVSHVGRDTLYRVPSQAMLRTFPVGATVLVDPASYQSKRPAIGDIIVFHPPAGADAATPTCADSKQGGDHTAACSTPTPNESSHTFIKRVVAGPGDTLQIRNGRVVRNGHQEREPFVLACAGDPSCNFSTPITIPPDDYFVLGDNRGASDDSRFWGPVPLKWIIGKVVRRVT